MIGVLRIPSHVSADPGEVGKELQHALETGVLVELGAVLGRILIHRAEPGIRVGDVNHDGTGAGSPRPAGDFDAPGGVHQQASFPAARSSPELEHAYPLLHKTLEQAVRRLFRFIRLLADGTDETYGGAEALAKRCYII